MRYSRLFGKTQKEVPKDATVDSHKLLLRGGFIQQVAAGIYSYLPLGFYVLWKVDAIIRDELARSGVQHMLMPFVHPSSLWEESGRRSKMAGILATFESAHGGECLLAPTHEETATDLARKYLKSYRDLPVIINHNQWKYRDEVRVSGGLLRTREFLMQDAYSFDRDEAGLDESFNIVSEAYNSIFERIGLPITVVTADSGTMGGTDSEEFMLFSDIGEDTILTCDSCEYKANMEKADSQFKEYPQDKKEKDMEAVEGKGIIGVEPLAKLLGIKVHQTTKTLIFKADDRIVAVMIRGDYDVSETKLSNHLKCQDLNLASAEVVKKVTGAAVGYAGPVGLPKDVLVLADLTCKDRVNFEAGANNTDYHNINVNFERDFPTPEFLDLRSAKEGDECIACKKGKLKEQNAIELGHVFKLGKCYAENMKAHFVDEDGKKKPLVMGSYGIGISRIVAAAVESSHDEKGIIWPENIAPFTAHLIVLGSEEDVLEQAEELYDELWEMGVETLFDERDASAGEKFADADLIGIPHRLVVSKKSLKAGGIEWKRRDSDKGEIIAKENIMDVFVPGSTDEVSDILKGLSLDE
jgi:prolyl-tRNA synthetase